VLDESKNKPRLIHQTGLQTDEKVVLPQANDNFLKLIVAFDILGVPKKFQEKY